MRLQRIESQLTQDDPGFAPAFGVLVGLIGLWWVRRTSRDPFATARRRERRRQRGWA